MNNIDYYVYKEVLKRCGKDEDQISTDLSNDLIERCSDVEDFVLDVIEEFEERILDEKSWLKKELQSEVQDD